MYLLINSVPKYAFQITFIFFLLSGSEFDLISSFNFVELFLGLSTLKEEKMGKGQRVRADEGMNHSQL